MKIIKKPKNISSKDWESWLDKEVRNFKRRQKRERNLEIEL